MQPSEKSDDAQYLYVVGRLYPDNRLELLPTFLTTDPQDEIEDPSSPLQARLYDPAGRLVLRYGVAVGRYCGYGTTIPELAVRGRIPFPRATSVIRFERDGVLIHEIQVSTDAPNISLDWEPDEIMTGNQTIVWHASHPEGKLLSYFLRYSRSDGAQWQLASLPTQSEHLEIDLDQFPGGERCGIMIVATDGVRTTTVESRRFAVPVKPCQAVILAPEDGAVLDGREAVWLKGQGYYLEEELPETENLVWISSKDGELGRGMMIKANELSPGLYQITLKAGTGERVGEASISITVTGEANQPWVFTQGGLHQT